MPKDFLTFIPDRRFVVQFQKVFHVLALPSLDQTIMFLYIMGFNRPGYRRSYDKIHPPAILLRMLSAQFSQARRQQIL